MSGGLYFRVLGPMSAERAGSPLDVGGPQVRTVLALLLLERDRVVSVDRLVEALWEGDPPNSWRVQLQGMVSRLRRTLGADGDRSSAPIETRPPGYRLRISAGQLDLENFRDEVRRARERLAAGEPGPAAALLRTALARWRGPVCADLTSPSVRRAADWDELRLAAVEDRIDADIALGRHEGLDVELRALIGDHPLRERCRGQLMTVLARAGRPAEALTVFRDLRERMVDELGIEPSTGLQQLHRAILTGVQGPDEAEAVRGRPYLVPRQLPADVPGHVGREDLLGELSGVLGDPSRTAPVCVAVTGPGGIGKTAFVLRLAHAHRAAYGDGQLYARLRDRPGGPAEVLAGFLHALGVPPAGVPSGLDERAALFRELLATRRVLIVLDDVTDATDLEPLLPAEPRCAVLMTSRRRLSGAGGAGGLRVVPLEGLPRDAGAALFRSIAGRGDRPSGDAEEREIDQIVRLCGGLPLAVRIAAARLSARPGWTVADLARRLASHRDRLDWLQHGDLGVRASFQDTYDALTDDHRRLFRSLGLLKDTEFPSWVPAALLGGRAETADRLLNDLVDVHLVEPAGRGVTGPRYRVHDLIHLLAGELAARDDAGGRRAAVRRLLGAWHDMATAADGALPHWYGLDPSPGPVWRAPEHARAAARADPLVWFDEERLHLIAQTRLAGEAGHPAWPLAQCLATYFDMRGRYDEWVAMLHEGLRVAERQDDRRGMACMLGLLVDAEGSRLELGAGLQYAERAMTTYQSLPHPPMERRTVPSRSIPDPLGRGRALFTLSLRRREDGEHGGYLPLFEEARQAFEACGAPIAELWMLKNCSLAYLKQGRMADAAACLARGLTILVGLGEDFETGSVIGEIGALLAAAGRHREAEELARETLARSPHPWDEAAALDILAALSRSDGDHHAAIDAHLKALAVWRRLGVTVRVTHTMGELARLCEEIGDIEAADLYRSDPLFAGPQAGG
ncbi:BTAD domain-containing putative transcriptional regulator [Actinomadura vinacea]|uniref:BTAD domain-containing putative transcriptional regulator n=1 Tax=Actinomadura vinacea TaxID=115336 RepID=A0ABP5W3W0_9ACTN